MNMKPVSVEFKAPSEDLKAAWRALYDGYATFYERILTDEIAETVWSWITDPNHELDALIIVAKGRPIGLAHYRRMPSPLRGGDIGFLDDLFIAPEARGDRIGERIFERLREIASERGWTLVRWVTADDNYRARSLYDRVATKTTWNMYEMLV